MYSTKIRRCLFGALLSFALLAAACGSDDATAPTTKNVTLPPAAADVVEVGPGEAIQIRSLNAISGDVAFLGIPNENGIRMAVADYGQIGGHDVEVGTGLDDLCSADGGQAAAQTIVADEDVIGVIGTSCSGAATAAAPLISEAGMVMISGSNTSPALTSDLAGTAGANYHEGYYRTAHNDLYQGQAAANFALEVLGVSSAAAIHDGDPYTEGLARAFADAFEAGGGTLTGFTAVNKGDTDMVPVLTEVAAGSPELLFFPIFQPEGDFIIQQSPAVPGLEDTVMMAADGLLNTNYLAMAETEGMYFSGPDVRYGDNFNESTGESAADVLADYEAEFGEAPAAPFWAHSYDAAVLLMDAIAAASTDDGGTLVIDRARVREYLNGVSNYSGLIGSMSCDNFGDCSSAKITVIQNIDSTDYEASTANVIYEYAPLGGQQVGDVTVGALPDLGGRVVTIAVDNAYLPFSYIPADTGVPEGWDYDALDEICARINCVPSFQEFVWDGTIIATGEGQFNMAAGGITITEERDEVVDFSISFISTDQKILVAKDNADIGSRADLEASDCTVGSMTGTTNYDLSVDVVGEARIAAFESFAFAVQALITGDVCAVIMDDVAGQGYQGENADAVSMLDEVLTSDPLGFAFTEGSDLVASFDAAIQSMKDDGTLAALNTKYFGTAFTMTYDDIGDGAYAEEPVAAPAGACIGLVTDVGQVDDKSFNQSAWEGVQAAGEASGADVNYIETQAAKDYATNIGLFADDGCDVIVTVGFALGEATGIASAEYPDIDFVGVDQWQAEPIANVAGLLFPEDQAGYLAGALAASLSTSGVIAEVLGTDLVPPVVAFGEGFVNGARHIDPSIEVIKTYHPGGLDVAFTDPEWGATTARQALDQGADVVFGAGGKTGNGAIIEVAGEAGAFCIGVDTDQWDTVPEAHPCLVSSSMKMITDGVVDLVGQSFAGSMPAGNYYGGVALAPFHDHADSVPADVQDMLVALKADLEAGTIPTCVWVTDAPGCEVAPEPVLGGTLRIGLEAETDGLNPAVNRFAVSAYQMGTAVYDYLVVTSDDPCGCVYVPSLAESWTSSDDNTTWDFKIREGVTFHDGTPLTAEAVLYALKMQLNDPTVGIAVRAFFVVDDPETEAFEPAELLDDMTIRYHAKRPHVDFPGVLTGQLGNVPSLAYMMAATDDPSLNQAPVGTGPFMFDSRVQDSMTRFVRNPDYWGDTAYLDAVEFYIYTDGELAAGAMAAGDIDVMGTSNTNAILTLRALDGVVLYETDDYEESFAMANSSRPPFDDIRARKALTYSFARDDYVEFIGAGVLRAADQASTPESPFYNPDVVQEHDTPDLATPLVAEYCADVPEMCTDGRINAEYQYSGPSVIQDQIFDLLTAGWSDHFNFTKDLLPQDDHITHAILGSWDFLTWRQFGSINPDGHILWTECQSVGPLSLNWPRYCDEERDALMFEARASDDREANVELWKEWAVNIHDSYTYLFQTHTMWTNAYDTKVKNVCGFVLPDGSTPLCHVNSANPSWAQMWIEG